MARLSIAYRWTNGARFSSGLCGGDVATTKCICSRPKRPCVRRARWRCPRCMGLNVPPRTPSLIAPKPEYPPVFPSLSQERVRNQHPSAAGLLSGARDQQDPGELCCRCDSDSGEADMLNWDAEKRRLRTLTGTDAILVQRLMGRSGGCSPGGSYGKRFQASHEASLDIPAFAVRPTRRTDRRDAPAAVRPPERPVNLCRRSSASYMFFVPSPVSESQRHIYSCWHSKPSAASVVPLK